MPDIAVSLRDQYTSGVKSMTEKTKSFSKEAETMINRLRDLGTKQDELVRKQAKLQTSTEAARKEMQAAQKAFKENSDEINRTNLEKATEQYYSLQEQMKAFRDESNRVRKEAGNLQSELSKMDNQAGSMGGGLFSKLSGDGLAAGLGKAGLLREFGNSLATAANVGIESYFGKPAATYLSETLSGAAAGRLGRHDARPYGRPCRCGRRWRKWFHKWCV